MHKNEAIFFDLDGTLLDTAQDFAYAINLMLAKKNKPSLNFDLFREQIYGESRRMVSFAFDVAESDPDFEPLKQVFLETYHQNCTVKTVFFEGMIQVLDFLDAQKIPWGVITNKPTWLTKPIADYFGLTKRACCIISGDTLSTCKPDPLPLLFACEKADVAPSNTTYVGDLETDVLTAKNAGTKSTIVTYGYHPPNADLLAWGADTLVASPLELLTATIRWNTP